MNRQILLYFLVRGSNGVLALASVYVLTRFLPAQEYGLFALALALMNVLASIFYQWITVGASRLIATHRDTLPIFFRDVRQLHAGASAALLLGLTVWYRWGTSEHKQVLFLGGVMAVLFGTYNLHLQILNSTERAKQYALLSNARAVLAVTFSAAFALTESDAAGALAGAGVGTTLALLLFGYRWEISQEHSASQLRARHQLAIFGVPLALTYAATMVLQFSDRFFIAKWSGPSAVASYAASCELATQSVGAFLNVFYLAGYPRVALAWEAGGPMAARDAIKPLARSIFLCAPAVAGLFICLGPEIAMMLVGEAVRPEAARIIPWVAAATAIMGIKSFLFDVGLHLLQKTKTLLQITIAMASVNVILNLFLIPELGSVGAGISSTAAFSIGALLSYWAARHAGVHGDSGRHLIRGLLVLFTMIGVGFVCDLALARAPFVERAGVKFAAVSLSFIASALLVNLADARELLSRRGLMVARPG